MPFAPVDILYNFHFFQFATNLTIKNPMIRVVNFY